MTRILFLLLFINQCDEKSRIGLDQSNLEVYFSESHKRLRECLLGLSFSNFKATAINGQTYSLDDFKGKIVLINLWFIGCHPCIAEIPTFNELSKEYSKDFVILSFGLDDKLSILEFSKKKQIDFLSFPDSGQIIESSFRMKYGYPTNIFLDRTGKIIEFKTGGSLEEKGLAKTKEEFKQLIERELKK